MNKDIITLIRNILDDRCDNAENDEVYLAYCEAWDIFEYALAENIDALQKYLDDKDGG